MSPSTDAIESPILIDLTCPLATVEPFLDNYIRGGVTALAPTVGYGTPELGTIAFTLKTLGMWHQRIQNRSDLLLIKTVEDISRAKAENRLGIIVHFQGSLPLEDHLETLTAYHELGLRILQICYNTEDRMGCGCAVENDTGLKDFGRQAIEEMNRLGILVDCAHTGRQTTLDTLTHSTDPVIISHGNAKAVCPSGRNLDDALLKAVADQDGIIGVNGFPSFVTPKGQPHLEDMVAHIRHMVDLVGEDHVAIGMDYFEYQDGAADLETAKLVYDYLIQSKAWNTTDYPPPPWKYPVGVEMPESLPNLTQGLLKGGFSADQVEKILGRNAMAVFKAVWR